jgi:hypothetical protein
VPQARAIPAPGPERGFDRHSGVYRLPDVRLVVDQHATRGVGGRLRQELDVSPWLMEGLRFRVERGSRRSTGTAALRRAPKGLKPA